MLTSNLASKGLNTDSNPKFQPEGTYRFALNSVLETTDGDTSLISNELSNATCNIDFPSGKKVIGHALTDTTEVVLFLFDPDPDRPEHEIGLLDATSCKYTLVAKSALFNFSDKHPINAIFRLKNGCERFIYWTDNYNPYRVANLSDTTDWVFTSTKFLKSSDKILYSRPYSIPDIEGSNLDGYIDGLADGGGELEYGAYSFAFQYIDYDGNPTDWMSFSRYFPIGANAVASAFGQNSYSQYTGASNVQATTTTPNDYYRSKTSKSILLNISNVSTDFSKFRLAVVKRTSDSGAVSSVDVLSEVDILNPSNTATVDVKYLYTGSTSSVVSQTSLEDLFSTQLEVSRVAAHTQAANRLVIANTNKDLPDYTGFQRHASATKVEWVQEDSGFIGDYSKVPAGYQEQPTFQHDEVYALGIVYYFRPGSIFGKESPVFHIPGRSPDIVTPLNSNNYYIAPLDPNPLDTYEISPSDPNVIDFDNLQRWRNYNTYTKYGPSQSGLLGYHQTTTTYGSVKNSPCDTHPDGYWGRDWSGNLISNTTHVRHHRTPLPCASLDINSPAHRLGLKFTVTQEYPHPDIIGHKFVYADRTNERTVLDVGLMTYINAASSGYDPGQTELQGLQIRKFIPGSVDPNDVTVNAAFVSNNTVYDSKLLQGSYVRLTKIYKRQEGQIWDCDFFAGSETQVSGVTVKAGAEDVFLGFRETPREFNFRPSSSYLLPKKTSAYDNSILALPSSKIASNDSRVFDFGIIVLDRLTPELEDGNTVLAGPFQAFIKSSADVYSDLNNLTYKSASLVIHRKEEGVTSTVTTFSGDMFTDLATYSEMIPRQSGDNEYTCTVTSISYDTEHFINSSLRSDGVGPTTIWKPVFEDASTCAYATGFAAAKLSRNGDTIDFAPEVYSLNRSYNYMVPDNIYIPLQRDYEFCNTCYGDNYPYRIYYSEEDSQESERDYYRTIRPNNYRDLDGYTGAITDLFTFKNDLFALTQNSPYVVPYRPQVVQTDSIEAYLGTGSLLSLPPQQLKTTEYAFGGTSHFKARVLTEYGSVYADDISGRVFLVADGLKDLTLKGVRNFFQENGRLRLVEQYRKITGKNYPFICTTSSTSVGYILTYDPRFKRVIVTKKDYVLTPYAEQIFSYSTTPIETPNKLWFDGSKWYFRPDALGYYEVDFTNPTFFQNVSFTMSYSFLEDCWVSFHSYRPSYLFNNYSTFFSDSLYKHNVKNSFQTYYGKKYDFVVDLNTTLDAHDVKTYSYSQVRNRCYRYNPDKDQYEFDPSTFDRAILYNSKQSSGLVTLTQSSDYDFTDDITITPVKSADGTYRISKFRDNTFSNTAPIWDSSWTALSPLDYIDKVPNDSNINQSIDPSMQPRLKDYYLGTRLFFKPTSDLKMTVDLIDTNFSARNR